MATGGHQRVKTSAAAKPRLIFMSEERRCLNLRESAARKPFFLGDFVAHDGNQALTSRAARSGCMTPSAKIRI
jgi:hypothetical protein